MIAYFDSSAFVPLVMEEKTSDSCWDIWDGAEKCVSTRLLHIETASALARAERAGRISHGDLNSGMDRLEDLWQEILVSELDQVLMVNASSSSRQFGLRGYDSVHCAAAFQMNGQGVVAASGDRRLREAWQSLGLSVFDPGV